MSRCFGEIAASGELPRLEAEYLLIEDSTHLPMDLRSATDLAQSLRSCPFDGAGAQT